MAIYYCNVQVISRGHGRNAVAAAAYRSRSKLQDRTGKTHDYRKRGGLSYDEIIIPKNAPERFKDRQILCLEVEESERRINSQLFREFVVGLQKELSDEENIKLVRDYAQEQFVNRGMIADICIHDLDSHNPHAHILLTMRHVNENGFSPEKKSARVWNKKEVLAQQRAAWSEHVNQALEKANIQERVDHRSYEERGINRESTVHLGWYAHNLEKQGIKTELGDLNREIEANNRERARLEKEIRASEAKLAKLKAQQIAEECAKAQQQKNKPKLSTKSELEEVEKLQEQIEKNTREVQKSSREFQEAFKDLEETIKQFGYDTEPEKSKKKEQEKIKEAEIRKKKDRGMGY